MLKRLTQLWGCRLCLAIVSVLFLASPPQSFSDPVYVDEHTDVIRLGPIVKVLEDREKTFNGLNLMFAHDDHLWTQSPSGDLNFGYTDSAFWIKSEIVNRSSRNLKFLFEIGYPLLDHIRLYIIRASGQKSGSWETNCLFMTGPVTI